MNLYYHIPRVGRIKTSSVPLPATADNNYKYFAYNLKSIGYVFKYRNTRFDVEWD